MDASATVHWAAERVQGARLRLYSGCEGVEVQRGDGWLAVATGVASNDMNGVVSAPDAAIDAGTVGELIEWFAARTLPASWLIEGDDAGLAAVLVESGAVAENAGWVTGRTIGADLVERRDVSVEVARVETPAALDEWLDVAEQCGWIGGPADRDARRALYLAVGLDHGHLSHWVARRHGEPVGMASAYWDGDEVVDLCNLGVLASERRRGIGTALARARVRAAHGRGARVAVAELSPEGWEMYRRVGFVSVPVRPDRWFHLPTHASLPA